MSNNHTSTFQIWGKKLYTSSTCLVLTLLNYTEYVLWQDSAVAKNSVWHWCFWPCWMTQTGDWCFGPCWMTGALGLAEWHRQSWSNSHCTSTRQSLGLWQRVKCGTVAKRQSVGLWQKAKCGTVAKRQSVGLWQKAKWGTVAKGKAWDCGKRQNKGLWQRVKCGNVAKSRSVAKGKV